MPGFIGELHHLILDARTVPGADTFDLAAVQGRILQVLPDHLMGALIGVGHMAHLTVPQPAGIGFKGEGHNGFVPLLDFQVGKVNGTLLDPGRGTGLETPQLDARSPQAFGELCGRTLVVRAGFIGHITHIDPSLEVGTGGQNHLLCTEYRTQGSDNPGHFPIFGEQFHDFRLFEGQVLLKLHLVLHILGVGRTVDLSPEGMHRRSLTPVEHPALEEGGIGSLAHFTAQGIDFPHQMSLGGTADGGIAGHIGHSVQ